MAYTFTPNASGNIEVFQNGQRVSTTTAQNASTQYGYKPTGGVAPAPTAFQQVQSGSMALGAVNTPPQTPYTPPTAPPAPVSVLSSVSGADAVQKASDKLKAIETTYTGPSIVDYLKSTGQASDQASRAKLAADKGVAGYDFSAEKNTELLNKLRAPASNPALGSMVKDIESSIKNGGLTSTETQGYNDLIKIQDGIVSASAAARKALESGDYQGMDFYLSRAKELESSFTDKLTKYYEDTRSLREQSAKLLSPTERERELGSQLVDIRSQIDQFNLQTEEDKFREYEGQTQGFAGGRASEIDIRAEFKRSRMALEEKNLLASLGLEQDARKMESDSIDKQLTYLAEDYDLQTKVQEKITQIEDDIFNRADTLREEAKSTLGDILDMLKGVNPQSIPTSTLTQLETFASRAGLPFDLVQQALKVQYDRQVFEDSISADNANRASEKDSMIDLTPEDERFLIGAGFQSPEIQAIKNDVNQYGINAVLDRIEDPSQKKAVQKVFGVQEKVTRDQISSTVTQKVAADGLKGTYTETELKELADKYNYSSMWTGKATDIERFLNSPEAQTAYVDLLYNQYKTAGMTAD